MARDRHTAGALHGEGESLTERLERLPRTRDWDAEWDAPTAGEIRFDVCAATEVYAQAPLSDARDVPTFLTSRAPRRTRWRGIVSLMWAGLLAVAAIQHAGEVERRISTRELSPPEFAVQERPTEQIQAAWREIGHSTAAQAAVIEVEARAPAAPTGATGQAKPEDAGNGGGSDSSMPATTAEPFTASQKTEEPQPRILNPSTDTGAAPNVPAPVLKEPIVQVKQEAQPQVLETAATETASARRIDEPVAAEDEADSAQVNPTAVQIEAQVETRRTSRQRRRQRAASAMLVATAVIVTPGEFVAARFFTVYGLNGRSP